MIRVGQGYDVHAFEAGNGLVLGGVSIPFGQSLKAHSDGDVLIHALCDALLGASGMGDIGRHFPDHDPRYRDISSLKLLEHVMALLVAENWQLLNGDMTIIAQAPKMAAFIPAMIDTIASALGCQSTQLNIKATTTEQLGYIGRGEGIACQASVLIKSRERLD